MDYIAPEVVFSQKQSEKTDIWCLGVLLYEILVGKPPFSSKNIQEKIVELENMNSFAFPRRLSKSAIDLISWLLEKDPTNRPRISEILNHPWVILHLNNFKIEISKYEKLSQKLSFDIMIKLEKSYFYTLHLRKYF